MDKFNNRFLKIFGFHAEDPAEPDHPAEPDRPVEPDHAAEPDHLAEPAEAAGAPSGDADGEAVFAYFEQIASIPHGSGNTKAVSDMIVQFAQDHGYAYKRDEANNVVITAPASKGCEDAAPIALQGHMDMVCASDPDKQIDMEAEGITVIRDGDWMYADGTTLGADNGIAVAMMLAILDDPECRHPLLECIFTSDEEIGLIGADALDLSELKSRRLLNLDSEEEGVICAGCAGGAEIHASVPAHRKNKKGLIYEIELSGLTGGHSAFAVGTGSANAIKLMARLLDSVYQTDPFCLVSIDGGEADNAVPRSCHAVILAKNRESLREALEKTALDLAGEYDETDPDLEWEIRASADLMDEDKVKAFGRGSTKKILSWLINLPSGVERRIPGQIEKLQTSSNVGVIETTDSGVKAILLARSSINAQNEMMIRRVKGLTELAGGKAKVVSKYPAWEFAEHSPFREKVLCVYRERTGKEAVIDITHGGLECGILADKVPGIDCLAIGPDLEFVHTTKERMSIPSAVSVYNFVRALLEETGGSEQLINTEEGNTD